MYGRCAGRIPRCGALDEGVESPVGGDDCRSFFLFYVGFRKAGFQVHCSAETDGDCEDYCRGKSNAGEEVITEEEIRMMVDLGAECGTIDSDECEWIDNVFEFGETTVREAMPHVTDLAG